MGWRGAERVERRREWLVKWLRGYAGPGKKDDHLLIMIICKDWF